MIEFLTFIIVTVNLKYDETRCCFTCHMIFVFTRRFRLALIYRRNKVCLFFSLVVNVKKIILIHFLFDLKKSC